MSVNRRFVLKGMALSGIAGATAGVWKTAFAAISPSAVTSTPLLVLTSGGPAEGAFLRGAMAACSSRLQLQRVDLDPNFMLDFERMLRNGKRRRIIGILDDAPAAPLIDMVRSGGARLQWLAQHTVDKSTTRHRLLSSDHEGMTAQQFSLALQADGASIQQKHTNQCGIACRQIVAQAGTHAQRTSWLSSVGYLLALPNTAQSLSAPAAPTANTPISGSFVSFSIMA